MTPTPMPDTMKGREITWRTCQFCHKGASTDDLVKYGVRHYAHYECYLDAGKSLDDLHSHQVNQFPFFLLKKRGLLKKAEEIQERDEARDREYDRRAALSRQEAQG